MAYTYQPNVEAASPLQVTVSPSLPPTYQSIFEEPQTPVKLTYVEFWPDCTTPLEKLKRAQFEDFNALVYKANRWLAQYPKFSIRNCETSEKKIADVGDLYNHSLTFTSALTHALYIKGLRLWIFDNENRTDSSEPIQIGYVDYFPKCLSGGNKHAIFEKLPQMYARINDSLLRTPIEGRILTIDTVNIKIGKTYWKSNLRYTDIDRGLNSRQCHWYDEYNTYTLKLTRIFYIVGGAFPELIGSVDFLPQETRSEGWFTRAKYAPFSELMEQTSRWVRQRTDLHIKNIQTLDTMYQRSAARLDTQLTFDEHFETSTRILFVRVAYTTQISGIGIPWNPPPPPPVITYKTFVPVVCSATDECCSLQPIYENLAETSKRIMAWLNATGAQVLYAEIDYTTKGLIEIDRYQAPHKRKSHENTMSTAGEWYFTTNSEGNTSGPYRSCLVYFVRVYLDGEYQEPHPSKLPPVPEVDLDCCTIL